jgi:tRNA 2-selenouridine synthase
MRSSKFAELLNENGYTTHTLTRGYKAYRNFVLKSFEINLVLLIIGGETGSGKTEILKNISGTGEQVIDLEALANHKGSAFGSLGEQPQPTQEQFENNLSHTLSRLNVSKRIWLEDESMSIGKNQLPSALWIKMKLAPILRINFPKQLRLERLVNDYGNFTKEELQNCILKIQKRLGPQHVKKALEELAINNLHEVANISLVYYDKAYNYNHQKRNMKDVFFIESETADAATNAKKIISFADSSLSMKQSSFTNFQS